MKQGCGLQSIAAGVFEHPPKIVCLPDGNLAAFVAKGTGPDRMACVRISRDSGDTWGEPETCFCLKDLPGDPAGGVAEAVLDRHGEIHVFMLAQWQPDARGEGERGGAGTYGGVRIDIWHARTTHARARWQAPRCLWEGYTGALNSAILLQSGRILLPFSYYVPRTWGNRGTGLDAFTFMGMFLATAIYSDDDGATWQTSNDVKVVTPDISYAYGACEPVTLQLADGRVWMLIRTQMGRFYEAFSADGAKWSRARPSRIVSSDSPAGLVRLRDGRIVLVWNNCLRHPYAYGGRQVIHAAISGDEGLTWRGGREVGRDPRRAEPPPAQGDHGTAYPFPSVTRDDQVLISTGQGAGRTLLMRLQPDYLYATRQKTNFTAGLEDWSVFGTRGVAAVPHPGKRGQRVLRLQREDEEFPAAAVWNFPSGIRGNVRLRCCCEVGTRGLIIGLTDHFSTPFDLEDGFHNVFMLTVGLARSVEGVCLEAGRWQDLCIDWDTSRRKCRVRVNGQLIRIGLQQRVSAGISYLRLRAAAEEREDGGVLVESVAADVSRSWRDAQDASGLEKAVRV